jgi:Bacterial Ig-like domain (group 3)
MTAISTAIGIKARRAIKDGEEKVMAQHEITTALQPTLTLTSVRELEFNIDATATLSVLVTAVTPMSGSAATPFTGTVEFRNATTGWLFGINAVSAWGTAAMVCPVHDDCFNYGENILEAVYSGDKNFQSSTGSAKVLYLDFARTRPAPVRRRWTAQEQRQ